MTLRPASALIGLFLVLAAPALAQGGQPEAPPRADAGAPWRVVKGEITRAGYEHYTEVPFDLPAGISRLTIRFRYGKEQHSVIDLGLRDPRRFRGWSGGTRDHMTLSTEDATPGYLPGPLPAGRWNVILGAPNIRVGARAPYEVQIFIERAPTVTEFAEAPIVAKPGWYRGDLHMHSGDSDGKCKAQSGASVPCPVYRTVEAAAARHLDFIALSDHNTTAHFNALRELQGAFDRTLLIPAREITTFWGHSNVFGPTDSLDFRTIAPSWAQARTWIDAVHREGGIVSINHPGAPSGEICMGCGWRIGDLPQAAVDSVEVVNGGTMRETGAPDSALQGLAYWTKLLNGGWHVTGIGGSDSHEADRPSNEAGAVGSPTTVVYMPDLSVHGFLTGIRSGRAFVDVAGTPDRFLDLAATAGAQHAVMGETLHTHSGDMVRFTVSIVGVASGSARMVIDGAAGDAYPITSGMRSITIAPWRSDDHPHWVRAEVRDEAGRLILIGNPIYLARRDKPPRAQVDEGRHMERARIYGKAVSEAKRLVVVH